MEALRPDAHRCVDITIFAARPSWAAPATTDAQTWAGEYGLELYLRTAFEVQDSVKKLGLKGKVLLDSEAKLYFKASDQTTLSTAHSCIIGLGEQLVNAAKVEIEVQIVAIGPGVKLKGKSRPRTHKQDATETSFKALKHTIYHEFRDGALDGLHPSDQIAREQHSEDAMHYSVHGEQTGEWTAAASDIMRRERAFLAKFHETRTLSEAVMGDANYHPNPCVLICPFAMCRKAHYHLNSFSTVSQLYSHWQKNHPKNNAARTLEARWRLANDNKKSLNLKALLDAKHSLVLTNEEMERLGGEEAGYEEIRKPAPSAADFKHRFDLNSSEHFEWLEAASTI